FFQLVISELCSIIASRLLYAYFIKVFHLSDKGDDTISIITLFLEAKYPGSQFTLCEALAKKQAMLSLLKDDISMTYTSLLLGAMRTTSSSWLRMVP
ncbi:hypothetical protein Tco_1150434, partial [Tanacetum coccineum]